MNKKKILDDFTMKLERSLTKKLVKEFNLKKKNAEEKLRKVINREKKILLRGGKNDRK